MWLSLLPKSDKSPSENLIGDTWWNPGYKHPRDFLCRRLHLLLKHKHKYKHINHNYWQFNSPNSTLKTYSSKRYNQHPERQYSLPAPATDQSIHTKAYSNIIRVKIKTFGVATFTSSILPFSECCVETAFCAATKNQSSKLISYSL